MLYYHVSCGKILKMYKAHLWDVVHKLVLKIVSDKLYLEPLMLTNGVEAASPILSLSESDLEYFLAMLTSLISNFVDILMLVSE